MVFGIWLLVFGYWYLVIGIGYWYWLLVFGYWLLVIWCLGGQIFDLIFNHKKTIFDLFWGRGSGPNRFLSKKYPQTWGQKWILMTICFFSIY